MVAAVEVELRLRRVPEESPFPETFITLPVVAESAVKLNIPVPVYIPVLVIAKSAPVVVVFAIETMSLAVVGVRVVDVLVQ